MRTSIQFNPSAPHDRSYRMVRIGMRDVPKNANPATEPFNPILNANKPGFCARSAPKVPPVAAPRTARVSIPFPTSSGESGSIVGVCIFECFVFTGRVEKERRKVVRKCNCNNFLREACLAGRSPRVLISAAGRIPCEALFTLFPLGQGYYSPYHFILVSLPLPYFRFP